MSDSRTKAAIPTSSNFNPTSQLPGNRSFVVPSQVPETHASQQPEQFQKLDAGVMDALGIQAQLAIGAPGDKYEQEADAVAAQVVEQINSPQAQQKAIQRQETLDEEDELMMKPIGHRIQQQEMPEEDEELQMKPAIQRKADGSGAAPANVESSIESARGKGQPLGDDVRGSMEQAFGANFSGVRVHTGSQSDQLNQSIQARAFTTGQDIFFKQGEYQPENRGGQELLAHELTHVVQQKGAGELERSPLVQKDDATEQSLQKDGGLTAGVGLALSAAGFAASTRPSGTDAFGNTNVNFRYSRDENGPHEVSETSQMIFTMDSIKGAGTSWAHLGLVLRYDGHNIISAYTQQQRVSGYDGGMFGSEAAVNFAAVQCSQPSDPVTQAYVIIQGFNNPSGPGFQRFRARVLVTGDGRIEPQECQLTEGSGYANINDYFCSVGWNWMQQAVVDTRFNNIRAGE